MQPLKVTDDYNERLEVYYNKHTFSIVLSFPHINLLCKTAFVREYRKSDDTIPDKKETHSKIFPLSFPFNAKMLIVKKY